MKVNIYGLTDATISFNTIGMMLRGKYSSNPEECSPCSVAYNLVLENEQQANEIMAIANLGLIRVEKIEEPKTQEKKVEDIVKETKTEVTVEEPVEEKPKKKKSPRRRKKLKEQKNETPVAEVPPASDAPEKVLEEPSEEEQEKTEVVVMTDTGPATGKMVHKMNGEINEDDPRCVEAMKAAKDLEEEEERLSDVIDDSVLDPSERMGSTAVIGTGNGKAETIGMKNSAVGERAEPNFIDLDDEVDEAVDSAFLDEDEEVKEKEEKEVENAFIDLGDEEEDDLDDAFIEI
jgi:hypothetical protein